MGGDKTGEKIFLQMDLRKSLERDADGNVIFTVEASNENLDMEGQRVLQSALLGTKSHFLKNGVVSKDHRHRRPNGGGGFDIDEEFVIGEPLDVTTDGASTLVRGKLYAGNRHARKFIELLDQGSSRVKASVGGLVPRVKESVENGRKVGRVVSVLWDDLALTIAPVNSTVGPAVSMAKSLSGAEFVKALFAGGGADASAFTGGRALQPESVERKNISAGMNFANIDERAVAALVGAIADGEVTGEGDAESFLAGYGISGDDARAVARALCNKGKQFTEVFPMARKNAWDEVKSALRKSVGGARGEDDSGDGVDGVGGGDGGDGDGDGFQDAGPVVKALSAKVEELQETIGAMAEAQAILLERSDAMQKSLSAGMLALMERTEGVLASPAPRRGAVTPLEAALAKALGGGPGGMGGDRGGGGTLRPFTAATMDRAADILTKAVADGEIDVHTCGKFETQMNKSVGKAAYPFTEDFVEFMRRKEAGI